MLPLETLPGWPEAPGYSAGFYLMLMIIGPMAVGVVVALLAWVPKLSARAKREADQPSNELTTY